MFLVGFFSLIFFSSSLFPAIGFTFYFFRARFFFFGEVSSFFFFWFPFPEVFLPSPVFSPLF